ncbi:MAG TPA: DUF29 domain-containing protein [Stellaceae bacterium]|jgi:hypothetical protein
MTDLKRLYAEDFVAWAKLQGEAVRKTARTGSNQELDWENIAEEIEGLGTSQRSALGSHIISIIQHLVKLEYSPAVEPRNEWRRTIRLARLQAQRRLDDGPSLKPELGQFVEVETRRGIELAIADLEEHGEIDEVDANVLRRARYTEEQILGDWFPQEQRG